MNMELYEIYWYPKCHGDREKESSLVLCNSLKEAKKIASECFKGVLVVEICPYGEGEEYWADFVMYNGKIMRYEAYEALKRK